MEIKINIETAMRIIEEFKALDQVSKNIIKYENHERFISKIQNAIKILQIDNENKNKLKISLGDLDINILAEMINQLKIAKVKGF